ncbi:MAG: hypothetical protein GY796_20280 [Chloroflexi bacterium]|nr:hypothetical protein [Chloroflexota bacterium]
MEAQDILILEPDKEYAERLVTTLNRVGSFTISVVPTVKEACLHLVQTPKDLAFIPITEGAKIIRSLRAIQPDLRLVLVTPTTDIEIPVTYSGRVQGVLIRDAVEVELSAILDDSLAQPIFVRETGELKPVTKKRSLDTAVLVSTFHQAQFGSLIQTAILVRGNKLLAYWGSLNEREAATVALHIGRDWPEDGRATRLQFVHLPARAGDLLLYTSHVSEDYLLTLVALPETPIGECRHQASQLLPPLRETISGENPVNQALLGIAKSRVKEKGRVSYALVWRPIEPLADALQTPIRQAVLRLATANGCVLTHIHIQAQLIHLVVTCPPEHDTAWAAYLFKSGSEQIIQQEYGVVVSLWETGYYATESTAPLTKSELNLFLNHTPTTSL